MTPSLSILRRNALWLPAIVLLVAGMLAASGVRTIGPAYGASTGTTTVTATVDPELHIGGTCPGGNLTLGTNMTSASGVTVIGSCTLTFGTTNNVSGALLRVESQRPTAADDTFCQTATVNVACGATKFVDAATAGAAALADGQFGVQVTAAQTCAAPTWTSVGANFYGINDVNTAGNGDLVCDHTTNATDASYALSFNANPATNTPSGTYRGSAVFTVETS